MMLEILERAGPANFHGGGQLTVLDRQLAFENPVFADLLERGELPVDTLDYLLELVGHRSVESFGHLRIHRKQRGQIRQAVTHQYNLVDQRLDLEQVFYARRMDFLAR